MRRLGAYFSFLAAEPYSAVVRNLDTEPAFSYCYELQPYLRLESVANAHTTVDLRARPDSKFALNLRP
jgi:hypothetical protein